MTVNQILVKFARKFPECDGGTALELFQAAHRRLLSRIPLRNAAIEIPVVAGVGEYALDPNVFKIHDASWVSGPGSGRPMTARSTDELDLVRMGWRTTPGLGEPSEYYVTTQAIGDSAGNAIGLVPPPPMTTTGGFPKIVLACTLAAELTGDESVPDNLLDDAYYLYAMYARWTDEVSPEASAFWEAKAQRELDLNLENVANLAPAAAVGIVNLAAFMPTRPI